MLSRRGARIRARGRVVASLVGATLAAVLGCSRPEPPTVTVRWLVSRPEPVFDPDGPPDPVRHALERLATRALVTRDTSGAVIPDAAASWTWNADSLTLSFAIRPGLRFTDGTPCGAPHFARALAAGLARTDHGTRAWVLAPVLGVDQVRAGRALPRLGIETPDSLTLVLRLARRDRGLLDRLARPGVSGAWKERRAGWENAIGLGPMRVASVEGGRLTFAGAGRDMPDTIAVRFAPGVGRARAALRTGSVDLVWPAPPGLAGGPLPPDYRAARIPSDRLLLLVMRNDLPPTTRLATRRALAHGINRSDLVRALQVAAAPAGALIPGAPPFEVPSFDLAQMRQWMEQGRLGRSFHVTMAYDADGPGAAIARAMQEQWTRGDVYVELAPRRGAAWPAEALGGTRSQLVMVEHEPLVPGPAGTLAALVMPVRGPAVGAFRTGWRTREFDGVRYGETRGGPPDPAALQRRAEEELIAFPLAALATSWVERRDAGGFWRFGAWSGPRFARP